VRRNATADDEQTTRPFAPTMSSRPVPNARPAANVRRHPVASSNTASRPGVAAVCATALWSVETSSATARDARRAANWASRVASRVASLRVSRHVQSAPAMAAAANRPTSTAR
jgi:hypothetical protein